MPAQDPAGGLLVSADVEYGDALDKMLFDFETLFRYLEMKRKGRYTS